MGTKPRWIVTANENRPIADVARDLAGAGMTELEVLDAIGCITGCAEEASLASLRGVDGVTDVSPDAPIDVGPPGTDPTW